MDTATHAYMFTHPLGREQQNDICVLFKCKKTQRWRETFLNNEWLHINEKIAHKM